MTILLLASRGFCAELLVPSPYPTIQAAIGDANPGDTVVVAPGTYTGLGNWDIDFLGKAITVRGVDPNDPSVVSNTVIDCGGAGGGFYFHSGEGPNSIVEGLTITNGNTDSGGAIMVVSSSPLIHKCNIIGNHADRDGGGIYYSGWSYSPSMMVVNCNITGNHAMFGGGGISCFGPSTTIIIDCNISDNTAFYLGGGIYSGGPFIVDNCRIVNNQSYLGGGILCAYTPGTPTINRSVIAGNISLMGPGGGGIYLENSIINMNNTIVAGNVSGRNGGGLYIGSQAGAIAKGCTFVGNEAPDRGGGVFMVSSSGFSGTNSIFWGNSDSSGTGELAQIYPISAGSSVLFSCIQDDDPDDASIPCGGADYGNIDDDPLFVRMPNDGGDGWGVGGNDDYGDLHLLPGSPCIDIGDPNYVPEPNETDLDGKPRVIGGQIDMGAYEFNHKPVADAGPNQVVYAWIDGIAEVTLDGSASYDADGDNLTYLWTWSIDGNTYDTNGVNPTIELPVGEHIIGLVVNDGWEDSEPNEITITVIEPIEGSLLVAPRIINGRCYQKRITAILRLPAGITKDQIDNTQKLLLYPGEIEASFQFIARHRERKMERVFILACFDTSALIDAAGSASPVKVDVVGQLKTGQYFYVSDTVRIINPPHRPPWRFHLKQL